MPKFLHSVLTCCGSFNESGRVIVNVAAYVRQSHVPVVGIASTREYSARIINDIGNSNCNDYCGKIIDYFVSNGIIIGQRV